MAQFVLVHGSFHGAWCWEKVIPLLIQRGHQVVAPDLPGSGDDPTLPANADLDGYATHVAGVIDNLDGKIFLVGHSMGGIVTAQVSEQRASRLAAAVYVNGLLLRNGESLVSFLDAQSHLGVEDLVLKHMVVSEDGTTATFPPDQAGNVFYNCCDPRDAEAAIARLRPQRMKVYSDRLQLTAQAFGSVPRFYIEGVKDNAVSLTYQRIMTKQTPCDQTFTLDGDHSPFLYAAPKIVGILDELSRRF